MDRARCGHVQREGWAAEPAVGTGEASPGARPLQSLSLVWCGGLMLRGMVFWVRGSPGNDLCSTTPNGGTSLLHKGWAIFFSPKA